MIDILKNRKCLQSPFYFTVANLVTEEDPETPLLPIQDYMSGSTVSSLYRLRDVDNSGKFQFHFIYQNIPINTFMLYRRWLLCFWRSRSQEGGQIQIKIFSL